MVSIRLVAGQRWLLPKGMTALATDVRTGRIRTFPAIDEDRVLVAIDDCDLAIAEPCVDAPGGATVETTWEPDVT